MRNLLEIIATIGAILGAGVLFLTFTTAGSAPQEAAGAALALGLAVIPYCLASMAQRAAILAKLNQADNTP